MADKHTGAGQGRPSMGGRFSDRYVLLDAVVQFLIANNSTVAAAKVQAAFGALKGTEEEPSP